MKCMIIAALISVALCDTHVFQSHHALSSHGAVPIPQPQNGYLVPDNGHGNGNGHNGHGNGHNGHGNGHNGHGNGHNGHGNGHNGHGNGHNGHGNGNGHDNGHGGGQIEEPVVHVEILKDERTLQEDGTFSFDVEADNGYSHHEAGQPSGPDGSVVVAGEYKYLAPDGSEIAVKYVADENGFVAESDSLPVAPEFPHEIPEFVLAQIEKAAEEDKAAEEAAVKSGGNGHHNGNGGHGNGNGGYDNGTPSNFYGQPDHTT